MIISSEQLLYENRHYANPQDRVQVMVKKRELIPLKRGLFENRCEYSGFCACEDILPQCIIGQI